MQDIIVGGVALFLQQLDSRHDKARGAKTALHRAIFQESSLDGMQLIFVANAFDGGDLGAMGARGGHQAAHHGLAIQPDGAGAAFALAAGNLGAGELAFVAQQVGQGLVLDTGEGAAHAVDGDLQRGIVAVTALPATTRAFFGAQQHRFSRDVYQGFAARQGFQATPGGNVDHFLAVEGRGAHIVDGTRRLGSQVGCFLDHLVRQALTQHKGFSRGGMNDDRGDGAQGDGSRAHDLAAIRTCLKTQQQADVDDRDGLGIAQGQLGKAAALAGPHSGEADIHQHLIRLHDGLAYPGIEFGQWDYALGLGRLQPHRGAQGHQRADRVVGRGSGDQIAGYRAAVTDLGRADLPAGLHQRQRLSPQQPGAHAVVMRDQWANVNDAIFVFRNILQPGEARDIDQSFDPGAQAALQLQDQVGGPGDQASAGCLLSQQSQRIVNAGGKVILFPHGYFVCLQTI